MKAKIIILVVITTILCSIFGTFAEAYSFDLSGVSFSQDEILEQKGTRMIRYFNGAFMHGFAKGEKIEVLTGDTFDSAEMLAFYDESKDCIISRYAIKDGNPDRLSNGTKYDGALFFGRYTTEKMIKRFQRKTNATVEKIICLSGEKSQDGVYICYLTDKGTYVLYKEYETSESLYLFPLDDFKIYAEKYLEERVKHLYNENGDVIKGGSFRSSDVSDAEKYLVNFERGSAWYIVIPSVFCVALVTLTVIFIMKRNKKS